MRHHHAFSLIELLVVCMIVGLLAGLILPVLGLARDDARNSQCLSNLHQITVALLAYESDAGRLPLHVMETGDAASDPTKVRGPAFDSRPLYAPYMNVDFFTCPFLPGWTPSQATSPAINVDYLLTPGYFGDGSGAGATAQFTSVSTRSDRPWAFNGRNLTVLAGDRLLLDPVTEPGLLRTVVNHGGRTDGFTLRQGTIPGLSGAIYLARQPAPHPGPDLRRRVGGNFAFADGSAARYGGTADMIPVPSRNSTKLGADYLLPAR